MLRDVIFVKKPVSVPEFAENKSCSTTVVEHNVLSLDGAIDVYLGGKPSENPLDWMKLLLSRRWHVPVTGGGLGLDLVCVRSLGQALGDFCALGAHSSDSI